MWIDVKKAMPPKAKFVWGFNGKKVDVLCLEYPEEGVEEFKITHWKHMRKPHKPKNYLKSKPSTKTRL